MTTLQTLYVLGLTVWCLWLTGTLLNARAVLREVLEHLRNIERGRK